MSKKASEASKDNNAQYDFRDDDDKQQTETQSGCEWKVEWFQEWEQQQRDKDKKVRLVAAQENNPPDMALRRLHDD
jgi:hypothetical protein